MGTTIKDIAKEAEVSIATVSFALNQTRYVSPELTERIIKIAKEKGYIAKNKRKEKYRKGKLSEIALIISSLDSSFYSRIITVISGYAMIYGYTVSTYITDNNYDKEKHILKQVLSDKKVVGIIISPAGDKKNDYKRISISGIPIVCIERAVCEKEIQAFVSDNMHGVYKGTEYLIKIGHENIALLLEKGHLSSVDECKSGYCEALKSYHIPYREELVVYIDLREREIHNSIKKLLESGMPTAIFVGGSNILTLNLLKVMTELGLDCPDDFSIVGFGDDDWCELVRPSLSVLKQNVNEIGKMAVRYIVNRIDDKLMERKIETIRVPMELVIRNSAHNIARGPFGEKALYPDVLVLSEEEERQLRNGNYKVAISFHYSGDEWTSLHERAIIDTLNTYGIRVLSVADAHFDPELQKIQLKGLMMQQPDAVIAVPVDEEKTAEVFKSIAHKTKLVLINSMPRGFEKNDYACWISVNERENGQNAAKILGDHFKGKEKVKVGMLVHGAQYFATKQRDFFAEQTLRDNYANIEIVNIKEFVNIGNAYQACRKMFEENADIQGLYITWERPALEVIRALKDMGRGDVAISTTDLDYEIARYMAAGDMVIGLSSQRPYDQGVAAAIATAKAVIGKNENKCIGVPPYRVDADRLEKAWKDLTKTKIPEFS